MNIHWTRVVVQSNGLHNHKRVLRDRSGGLADSEAVPDFPANCKGVRTYLKVPQTRTVQLASQYCPSIGQKSLLKSYSLGFVS